jgi:hypothetical protein
MVEHLSGGGLCPRRVRVRAALTPTRVLAGRSTNPPNVESLSLRPALRDGTRSQLEQHINSSRIASCAFQDAVTTGPSTEMSAAKFIRGANVTPVSTPPGPQSSESAWRAILAKRATRIDDLEIENATLQAQLDDALSRNQHDEGVQMQSKTTVATGTETPDDYALLKQQYQELEARHQKLQADYDAGQRYVEAATKKYEAAKLNAMQWKSYITKRLDASKGDQTHEAPRGADAPLPQPPPPVPREISDINITPKPTRRASPEAVDNTTDTHTANEQIAKSSKQAETSSVVNGSTQSADSDSKSKRISSSQTTEDDQAEIRSSPIKFEALSDDEPVIVRENILKRRRNESASAMPSPQRIKQEPVSPRRPGSAEEPVELRSDDWSSPVTGVRPLIHMETSDLDAMRGTYQTPRKRKSRDDTRARSEERSMATLHPPSHLARNSSSLSDSNIPDLPAPPVAFERAEGVAGAHQMTTPKQNITPKERSHGRQRGALSNLSPNVPTISQTARKRRRSSEETAGKVSMLAEDGDENTSQVTPKIEIGSTKTPASHRLDAMLENPTPGRQPLSARRPAPDTMKRIRPQRPQQQRESMSHTKTVASASRYHRPPGIEKSPPPINPESEPLRSRPMQRLRPQDFRINPAFADSDYAFDDPMNRKTKAARRCLPGCINPACCGEFLDAARHGLLPPSSKSDAQVIEDMFGSSHAEIMAAYPPSRHPEILIQARAQEFANEHGKHRKTFERAATPPGFWRTEMPSTQEEIEDRRKALEMERMKVEGMWREAMRGGGRWLFRDE